MCALIKESKWLIILALLTIHTVLHKLVRDMVTFVTALLRHYLIQGLMSHVLEFLLSLIALPWLIVYGNAWGDETPSMSQRHNGEHQCPDGWHGWSREQVRASREPFSALRHYPLPRRRSGRGGQGSGSARSASSEGFHTKIPQEVQMGKSQVAWALVQA